MPTTLTRKGQVTIPKAIRDALNLSAGCQVEFAVNDRGEVILRQANTALPRTDGQDRFAAARGRADFRWRTDELMSLLRGDD